MSTYKPPSPPMIAARWKGGSQTPTAIVMHGTVSPCESGGARATAHFFATEDNKTSAHYVVDPGEVVQCVGDHTIAYHCGYNTGSIGVEMTDPETGPASRWSDGNHTSMLNHAATLVAELCLAYDIEVRRPTVAELKAKGPHGIYGHNDSRLAFGSTTHTDPIGFPWPHFLTLVKAEAKRLSQPTEPKAPTKKAPGKPVPAPVRSPKVQTTLHDAQQIAQPKKRKTLVTFIKGLFKGGAK